MRRSRNDILADILAKLHEPTLKTRLMYSLNLSYSQLQEYTMLLEAGGIIQKTYEGKLVLTEKGRRVAELYEASRSLNLKLERLVGYQHG